MPLWFWHQKPGLRGQPSVSRAVTRDVAKATARPALIIQPKSCTGLMLLKTSELNPMMVVTAA